MREIIVIAHDIRSTHNVGSILRTADGLGAKRVICSGYTPYPQIDGDSRLPHIRVRLTTAIAKTALGAERSVAITHAENLTETLESLRADGYRIVALEQTPSSTPLPNYQPPEKLALLVGEEVHGIPADILALCDETIEIPMYGQKESFNVSVATGIALYHLRTQ